MKLEVDAPVIDYVRKGGETVLGMSTSFWSILLILKRMSRQLAWTHAIRYSKMRIEWNIWPRCPKRLAINGNPTVIPQCFLLEID